MIDNPSIAGSVKPKPATRTPSAPLLGSVLFLARGQAAIGGLTVNAVIVGSERISRFAARRLY